MNIVRFGARAVLVELDVSMPDRAARTRCVADRLRQSATVVAGVGTLLVDPCDDVEALAETIAEHLHAELPASTSRSHVIPMVYDGPDLEEIAARTKLSVDDVIRLHSGTTFTVELLGFLPGFAYLTGLPEPLHLPRRAVPRARVEPGSVGIAMSMSGIYPFASPGGWNLVGRAVDVTLFDPHREPPVLFQPGDTVRFERVAEGTFVAPVAAEPPSGNLNALVVERASVAMTVQDRGRADARALGVPPSGPLDEETLILSNLAVGNHSGAAAIEVPLGGARLRCMGSCVVSIDGAPSIRWADGDVVEVPIDARAVHYVAVAGGVDVPAVLGSRSTLLVAGLGGIGGRALRRGDRIPVGTPTRDATFTPELAQVPADTVLDVDPGPHQDRFAAGAFESLLQTTFTVSPRSDRTGTRLDGARIAGRREDLPWPVPMIRGAMQVTNDGTPIVLGPDHPVTGGYPVLAVVEQASQAVLGRLKPGTPLRFRLRR